MFGSIFVVRSPRGVEQENGNFRIRRVFFIVFLMSNFRIVFVVFCDRIYDLSWPIKVPSGTPFVV